MTVTRPTVTRTHRPDLIAAIERMPCARHLGLVVIGFAPGASLLELPIRPDLTFDGATVQGGYVATLADYAAVSAVVAAMPAGWFGTTTHIASHNLDPARGDGLVAIGTAIKADKGASIGAAQVYASRAGSLVLVATALATCRLFEVTG